MKLPPVSKATRSDDVVLVDIHGREIGHMAKLLAHQRGELHRAFSIFVFNRESELLLQRRAAGKYHSGGLWSNTCCSHPQRGESVMSAARRRLKEEMGFDCVLEETANVTYKAEVDAGLVEHEYDHVLVGISDHVPRIDKQEAQDWRWTPLPRLAEEMERFPDSFTHWFKLIIASYSANLFEGLMSLREAQLQDAS